MPESIDVPKLKLAFLPTPLEALPTLSKVLGGPELWIKRDDQTGLAFGGNKVRKLEFLLADARENEAELLITRGAYQSNHCRQTAAAAAKSGFECKLVLTGGHPKDVTGNLLLDELLGAEMVWSGERDAEEVLIETFETADLQGLKPYLIPYGGSNELGVYAYAKAMEELHLQDSSFDRIVFASSSGGTQAGLILGAHLTGFEGEILGISVDKQESDLQARISNLVNSTAQWLGDEFNIEPDAVRVDDGYLGDGYAKVGNLEREAIRDFAQQEGILLDPVYTGRAAGGLMSLIRRGEIEGHERVLFWHTGGTPALFVYGEGLIVG
jgi:D-cysteine desulfhydrase family pyridoxal phosphate-dependent enzyme